MRVVHERGFAGSSVRDIVQAAGVPQGSFTNHFQSKEAFALEVLNVYHEQGRELTKSTLLNDSEPPIRRLKAWVDGMLKSFNQNGQWNGWNGRPVLTNECHIVNCAIVPMNYTHSAIVSELYSSNPPRRVSQTESASLPVVKERKK